MQHHPKSVLALVASLALAACGGSDTPPVPEETRPQDTRSFKATVETTPFAALAGATMETDRWVGVLNGAAYRVEVPKTWNGKLVMWAHGYAGTGEALTVGTPIMRRYLIENGYAWAASSYSKNYYDVKAGVEDTNALALEFNKIATANSRALAAPSKVFITGISMGGHITAAAIEEEAARTAINKVKYAGAVPMCGVVGDNALFNYFAGYQVAAQQLAAMPMTAFPVADFATLAPKIQAALWSTYPTQSNATGDKLKAIVMNMTGGPRPFYAEGWANAGNQGNIWASIGGDGTISGILNKNELDTSAISYRFETTSGTLSSAEQAFNTAAFKIMPTADANRLRTDGLRWIPVINGEFSIPVVTIHTLGDLFVPFHMEQTYRQRATAKGNDKWLVQRAIRDVGHCAFTAAEASSAFDAMVKWEGGGAKPDGDDVLTADTLADPKYGCKFTVNTPSAEDYTAPSVRAGYQAKYPSCN